MRSSVDLPFAVKEYDRIARSEGCCGRMQFSAPEVRKSREGWLGGLKHALHLFKRRNEQKGLHTYKSVQGVFDDMGLYTVRVSIQKY